MSSSVSRYSLAVRFCALLVFGMAVVNAILIFGFAIVPMDDLSGFARVWMTILAVLNGLLVVGVAFQAADAGLAGGPADRSARSRLVAMTGWLPIVAIGIVSLTLVSSSIGRLVGDQAVSSGFTSPRQVVGLLILVGWSLFGWAAVLRWLKQGPSLALTILTRVMEVLALAAMTMDVWDAVLSGLGGSWAIGISGVRVLDAISQALAVVVCVEAVSNPDPSRLNGLLGRGLRGLQVMAWTTLIAQIGTQSLAIMQSGDVALMSLVGPLSSVAGWLLAFNERSLLVATLWAREARVLVSD